MFARSPKWHEGKKWGKFLKIYDEITQSMFDESLLVPTKFGNTQVHIAGDPNNPPLIFFHGISSCSIMFGNWLFPKLSQIFYCIALDTIGDMGRSYPKGGDPNNGPNDEPDIADWAIEVLEGLNITQPVKVIGYSMGAFLATCIARHHPERVDKMVLMAPACVFAPINKWWLFQAIAFGVVSRMVSQDGAIAEKLRLWFFGSMVVDVKSMEKMEFPELRQATDDVGGPQVKVKPVAIDVQNLTLMNEACPTLMIIGRQENVIDPKVAVDTAKQANIRVIEYDNASHMFFLEHPQEATIGETQAFLSGSWWNSCN